MHIAKEKSGAVRTIEVSGALTVAHGGELRKALLEDLRKGTRLEIAFGEVTEVDLSFFQIMAAALKTAETRKIELMVRTPLPERVVHSAQLAGLLNHSGCSDAGCVWCSIKREAEGV